MGTIAQASFFNQKLEDQLLHCLLVYDKLPPIVFGVIRPTDFSTSVKSRIYEFSEIIHEENPGLLSKDFLLQTADYEVGYSLTSAEATMMARKINQLFTKDPPEWDWIIGKISGAITSIRLQRAMFEATQLLENNKVEEACEMLLDPLQRRHVAGGMSSDSLDLSERDIQTLAVESRSLVTSTNIEFLDKIIGGVYRKELMVTMAPLAVGKSWFAVHMAVAGVLSGCKVLYYTLEMSKQQVQQRILQNVAGAAPAKGDAKQVTISTKDTLTGQEITYEVPTLNDAALVKKCLGLLKRYNGFLSISEYPSGTATIATLEKDLYMFQATKEAYPDLIIVDGLMDISQGRQSDSTMVRKAYGDITKDLRRLAIENNAAVIVTHQANREAIDRKLVGVKHTGEALGIMQVADIGLTLNQTADEKRAEKLRIHVARSRNTEKWNTVEVQQCLTVGAFALSSKEASDAE